MTDGNSEDLDLGDDGDTSVSGADEPSVESMPPLVEAVAPAPPEPAAPAPPEPAAPAPPEPEAPAAEAPAEAASEVPPEELSLEEPELPGKEEGEGAGGGAETGPAEPTEPASNVEPLGEATEETLAQGDPKAWILEKLYHLGSMGRLKQGEDGKSSDDGSMQYEEYKWQLEKLYRQVPEDMSLGNMRLKRDEFLYEGENFILGKLFRQLREADGYIPTAEKDENLVDNSEAIEVSRLPPEPRPCPLPSYPDDEGCAPVDNDNCTTKITSPSGKVYEFTYSGLTAVVLESDIMESTDIMAARTAGCTEGASTPAPVTPFDPVSNGSATTTSKSRMSMSSKVAIEGEGGDSAVRPKSVSLIEGATSSTRATGGSDACAGGSAACQRSLRCEAQIQAVCQAARKAMAIYDTVTGCDNYPCNMCDKPELEGDSEDGVWSWLYQLIYKMVPLDNNSNSELDPPGSNERPDDI